MFCHVCGKPLNDGAQFCSYCGAKVVIPKDKAQNVPKEREKEQPSVLPVMESEKTSSVTMSQEKSTVEENSRQVAETMAPLPWKRIGKKLLSWTGNVFWFLIIVIAGGIGKAAVHDPNISRTMAYVLPGAMAGLVAGIICCILADKFTKSHTKAWMIASVLGCIAAGVVGGYAFAAGAGVIIAIVLFSRSL